MGCCMSDKAELVSKSELAMVREEDLGFDSANLEQLVEGLKAGNRNYAISWIRLQELYAQFHLPTEDMRKPDTAIGRFYKSLAKEKDSYDTLKLIMLAVLLCHGSPTAKAKIIFSNFDTNENQTISKEELLEILTIMLEVACTLLPAYILARSRETKSPDIGAVEKYQQRLDERKAEALRLLQAEMKEEQLAEPAFIAALQNTHLKALCSARSLRQFTATPQYYSGDSQG